MSEPTKENVGKQVKEKKETFKEAVIFTGGLDSTVLLKEVNDRGNREVIPIYMSDVAVDQKRNESIQYFLKKFNLSSQKSMSFGNYKEVLEWCYANKINKLNIAFTLDDDPNKEMIDLTMMNEQYLRDHLQAGEDPKEQFRVDIVAPFFTLPKQQIIELAQEKGIEIEKTAAPHYNIEVDKKTGLNVYTQESLLRKRIREKAFQDARVQDPHGLIPKNLNPNK